MNVTDKSEQVSVVINKNGLVSSLEKMTKSFLSIVEPARITERQVVHDFGKRHIRYLNRQVNMIAHQAKGMNSKSEAIAALLQQKKEAAAILI